MDHKQKLLRALPKVDEILGELLEDELVTAPKKLIKKVIQKSIAEERLLILENCSSAKERSQKEWISLLRKNINQKNSSNLKRVINGTGVVIHTNLGRSILSRSDTNKLMQAGGFYSNLEFDLSTGKRGSRYSLVEEILCDITGSEAALVVNNNAAAVLLALDTIATGKEVIVSRGQLVEIGGSFRIPDIMEKSGAKLVEVGATNRTHLYDYENALTDETALLLRVHTSNFRIIGFTSDVSVDELVSLAKNNTLISMEDLGSGSLIDLTKYGFPREPTVQEIVKAGVDVVTFSGDKLLGGPQAGIIVGKKKIIDKIKKNQLNRALRIDKFTLASLENVLREYYDPESAVLNIPTLAMLTVDIEVLKKRATRIQRRLSGRKFAGGKFRIVPTWSKVGGGALPEHNIGSWAVELIPTSMKLSQLEIKLRQLEIPIVGRIEDKRYILDVRTILDQEISELVEMLTLIFTTGE